MTDHPSSAFPIFPREGQPFVPISDEIMLRIPAAPTKKQRRKAYRLALEHVVGVLGAYLRVHQDFFLSPKSPEGVTFQDVQRAYNDFQAQCDRGDLDPWGDIFK